MAGIKVVVTGATGNIGTSVVRALAADDGVASIHGLARRQASWRADKFELAAVDVSQDDLVPHLRDADVLIHLAWMFQPTHRPQVTWHNNVLGSIRVFEAAVEARVPNLVYASSIGAYSPGPDSGDAVDENWPTHGWPRAAYPMEKAYLERYLDHFEDTYPTMRVVRLRPGFSFKRASASQQRRLFAGRLVPGQLATPALIPMLPFPSGLRLQAVHSDDVAQAYRLAATGSVRGAFNVAAEPAVESAELAGLLRARPATVPAGPVRVALSAAWHLRAVPASPGLFDTVLRLPLMDCGRARTELGWTPEHSGLDALAEFLEGLREGAGMPTAPLAAQGS